MFSYIDWNVTNRVLKMDQMTHALSNFRNYNGPFEIMTSSFESKKISNFNR